MRVFSFGLLCGGRVICSFIRRFLCFLVFVGKFLFFRCIDFLFEVFFGMVRLMMLVRVGVWIFVLRIVL